MAIHYDGTDDYHSHQLTAVQVGNTYTMGCWVRRNSGAFDLRPIMVRNNTGSAKRGEQWEGLTLGEDDLDGGGPSNPNQVHAITYTSPLSFAVAAGTTPLSLHVWYHVAASFRDVIVDRRVYLNGVEEGQDTDIKAGGTLRVSYAALERGLGVSRHEDFDIAEPAFWDVILTDAEILSWAQGNKPDQIRPASLKIWNRFINVPPVGMLALPTSWTTGSVPTSTDHPPVIEPMGYARPRPRTT